VGFIFIAAFANCSCNFDFCNFIYLYISSDGFSNYYWYLSYMICTFGAWRIPCIKKIKSQRIVFKYCLLCVEMFPVSYTGQMANSKTWSFFKFFECSYLPFIDEYVVCSYPPSQWYIECESAKYQVIFQILWHSIFFYCQNKATSFISVIILTAYIYELIACSKCAIFSFDFSQNFNLS
jgi:hypothetical protein